MLIAMLFAFSFRDDDVRFHVAAILVLLDYHYIDFVSVGSCESISYPVSDSGFTLATDTVVSICCCSFVLYPCRHPWRLHTGLHWTRSLTSFVLLVATCGGF